MKVLCGGNTIPTTPNPKYIEVTLGSCLTCTKHLSQLSMKVLFGGNTIPTTPNPKYIGDTLGSCLTYTIHLSQLSMKVNARCNLLRLWGAHFDVLQTPTTALAFAPAEYCSPVRCPKCPHTSTRCSSEQQPTNGVWMHPIDTNLHATCCQRDNAS